MRALALLTAAVAFWSLCQPAAAQSAAPKAKNASQDLLLTLEDYLRILPAGDIATRTQQAAQAPNAFTSFRENWPTRTGNYHLNFEHMSGGAIVNCYLTVATTEHEARRVADESYEGWLAGIRKKTPVKVSAIEGLQELSRNGRFSILTVDSGALFANLFVVREGRNVVVFFLRGPLLFADAQPVRDFLGPKLPGLISFTPLF